jgi:hypothetical protein
VNEDIGSKYISLEREINPLKEYLSNTILVIIGPKHVILTRKKTKKKYLVEVKDMNSIIHAFV